METLPKNLNDYTAGRIDQTLDLYLDNEAEVDAWVRLFAKSMRSPAYQRKKFTNENIGHAGGG